MRFSIVATLAAVDEAEFALVRDEVEVSDSVLSKQVSSVEQAGHVKVHKGHVGKWPAKRVRPGGRRGACRRSAGRVGPRSAAGAAALRAGRRPPRPGR
ncbi:MAG TPA: transcriptional regulator [Ornithinibacter sp.]|nr:transcriptional regulator [Ornithinibacter sp.]